MSQEKSNDELNALNAVLSALSPYSSEIQRRIIDSALVFLGLSARSEGADSSPIGRSVAPPSGSIQQTILGTAGRIPYTSDDPLSPKDFMRQKNPGSDVERVACLAYYLTHFRDMPYFKTLDISKLNTEAAQPKLSNAAKSTGNALQYGYLAPGPKGQRQLSASGEDFVNALPDRELAKQAISKGRPKKRSRAPVKSKLGST